MCMIYVVNLIFTSCDPPNRQEAVGEETRTELDRLADNVTMDTEDKYHLIGDKFVVLLREALRKGNEAGTAEHIEKFYSENQRALRILQAEVDQWYKSLHEVDRIDFMLRLLAEDYPRQLRQLVPQVENTIIGRTEASTRFQEVMRTIELKN